MSSSSDEQAPAEGKPAVSGSGAETSGVQSRPQVAVAGSSGGQVSIVLDASAVASALNQARGPILGRISSQVGKFSGDGTCDVSDWVTMYERHCALEQVAPTDLLLYMLGGGAARLYGRMMVSEASNWDVVKGQLLAEYAMPRQEAWRMFTGCQLEAGDSVDVYLDRLERFGGRIGLTLGDLAFRVKFYEGLPTSVYEWAVSQESAYTADFGAVLARVRDRLVTKRAASGRQRAGGAGSVAAAGQQTQKEGGSRSCFRCGGDHVVKACPITRKRGKPSAGQSAGQAPAGCFRCRSVDHFIKDCPLPAQARQRTVAGSVERGSGFHEEGAGGGAASSVVKMDQS